MWPLSVRSSSPSSQSHILIVQSSEPEAREVKTGWNATHVTASRCDSNVCREEVGSQFIGSFPVERAVGDIVSSSVWSPASLDSKSKIYTVISY